MRAVILYREGDMSDAELNAARSYFFCTPTRMDIRFNDIVINRYSALPFYKEQERDIQYVGAKLLNSYHQHCYVADLWNWYHDLKDYTPKTWNRLEDIPEGSFVLKGKTNSKKFDWNTDMMAPSREDAIKIHSRLSADYLIGSQDIYIREYVPLKTYFKGIKDLPITKEFRFFVMNGKILSGAYYWSSHVDDFKDFDMMIPNVQDVPMDWLQTVIDLIKDKINFFVIDVAETESGGWIVVELNDGSMSGLSENDPNVLYKNMKQCLNY